MKKLSILCVAVVSVALAFGCGKGKPAKSEKKAKPGAAATPMKAGKGAPRAAVKAKVPMFKGGLESSPWVVKELTGAGFPGLTMRVPKNAEIKKDMINSKVGVINNTDGFAVWFSAKKLDIAEAAKAAQKSGLRPFKGWIEQKPDHLIYKFKGLTEEQIYFKVALKVDGKDYACQALGGITISVKEVDQVKQVVKACKTLKKK